jgi:hypothetical protein
MSLTRLFDQHALASYDKQLCLAEEVQDRPWHADLQTGLLHFEPDIRFKFQVLGSQSEYDNTWLWAWANTGAGLPPALIRASERLRDIGASLRVEELRTPKFDLGTRDGHYVAMVACGLCGAACYYRAPYDEGAAFLLIPEAEQLTQRADVSAHFIVTRVMEFISAQDVLHRPAIESYLAFKGYTYSYEGRTLIASSSRGESLSVEFDDHDRVGKMEAIVSAPIRPTAKNRPWWKFFVL